MLGEYVFSGTTDNIEKMNIVGGGASIVDTNLKEERTSKGKGLCSSNNNQMYSMDETKEINSGMYFSSLTFHIRFEIR